MQSWRNGDDQEELVEPISGDEWIGAMDPDKSMGDISNGWGWRSTESGLERSVNPVTGEVSDETGLPGGQRIRLASLPLGLSLSLNTDW